MGLTDAPAAIIAGVRGAGERGCATLRVYAVVVENATEMTSRGGNCSIQSSMTGVLDTDPALRSLRACRGWERAEENTSGKRILYDMWMTETFHHERCNPPICEKRVETGLLFRANIKPASLVRFQPSRNASEEFCLTGAVVGAVILVLYFARSRILLGDGVSSSLQTSARANQKPRDGACGELFVFFVSYFQRGCSHSHGVRARVAQTV
jgi:hypothetical protein